MKKDYFGKSLLLITLATVGATALYAFVGPTQWPPDGNVDAPITTGSGSQIKLGDLTVGNLITKGTIVASGDICGKDSLGATKCLSTMSALGGTGSTASSSLSSNVATCTIASGGSTCAINFTWVIENATNPNLTNINGVTYSNLASGTNTSYNINYGSNTVQTRDGSTMIKALSLSASCISPTTWNGSICAPPPPPPTVSATLSSNSATCSIASGSSSCSIYFTWSILNATTPKLANSAGTIYSNLASGSSVAETMSYGATTVQAMDGASIIKTLAVSTSCTSGTMWDGSKCAPPSATIQGYFGTGTQSNCPIVDGTNSCNANISWGIYNAVNPNIYNANTGVQYTSGLQNGGGSSLLSITHGGNTIQARDGNTVLASVQTNTVCSGDPNTGWGSGTAFWNGTICDPSWVGRADIPVPTGNATAVSSNGKVYLFGGNSTVASYSTAVYEYDPVSNSWAVKMSMTTGRYNLNSATLDPAFGTKIYVMSGIDSNGSWSSRNDEFSPVLNTWTAKAIIPNAPTYLYGSTSAPSSNGKIYLYYGSSGYIQEYDPSLNKWTLKTLDPIPRSQAVATAIGDKIYVIGGTGTDVNCNTYSLSYACSTVEEYNTSTNVWTTKTPMKYQLYGHTVSVANGKVYVFGGTTGVYGGTGGYIQEYDPVGNAWRLRTGYDSWNGAASASVNNKVYVLGNGSGWGSTVNGYNYEYTPAKDLLP